MRLHFLRVLFAFLLGAAFVIPAAAARLPMYQMYNSQWQDFFYTTNSSDRSLAINYYGYVDYGIAFYVDDGTTPGVTPFYRFYKGEPQYDHFYTSDYGEVSFVLGFGYSAEGNEGYVFNNQGPGSVPIYRLSYYNGYNGDLMHFYTPDYSFALSLTSQGWSLDSTLFYAFTSPDPPAITPIMVHATQLTAPCADKYCVRITGFNFASNAYIEMRSGNANGPVIWTEYNYTRGASGDATTLDVVLTNPGVRSTLDHPDGIWFYVVNPGNPSASGGGFNVIRDNPYSLKGTVMDFNASFLNGWICTDRDYSKALTYKVRSGSDSGEIGDEGTALAGGGPDVEAQCGGYGGHVFGATWPPARWRDGQTRQIYVIANIDPDSTSFFRYPNALVPGSPKAITLPNVPWDSSGSALPITVPRGQSFGATLNFKNRGNANWTSGGADAVFVSQVGTTVSWMPDSQGLPYQPIGPDAAVNFNVAGTAPSTPGTYLVHWSIRHGSTFFGTTVGLYIFVE